MLPRHKLDTTYLCNFLTKPHSVNEHIYQNINISGYKNWMVCACLCLTHRFMDLNLSVIHLHTVSVNMTSPRLHYQTVDKLEKREKKIIPIICFTGNCLAVMLISKWLQTKMLT